MTQAKKTQRLYVIGPSGGPYKVGVSNNPEKRRMYLQIGNHENLVLHFEVECDNPMALETWVHDTFYDDHIGGEWVTTPLETLMEALRGRNLQILICDRSAWIRQKRGKKPKPPQLPKEPKIGRVRRVDPDDLKAIRIAIRIPAQLKSDFQIHCKSKGMGFSEAIRLMIDNFLEENSVDA